MAKKVLKSATTKESKGKKITADQKLIDAVTERVLNRFREAFKSPLMDDSVRTKENKDKITIEQRVAILERKNKEREEAEAKAAAYAKATNKAINKMWEDAGLGGWATIER